MNGIGLGHDKDASFSCAIETLDQEKWHCIVGNFNDATLYQTVPFCTTRIGSHGCEHLIVSKGTEIVAVAQIRLISVPYTGHLIAYVLSGPLFHCQSDKENWDAFRHAVRGLRAEYVDKRKISLRVNTLLTHDNAQACFAVFKEEGFSYIQPEISTCTLILDLQRPLDDLRKGLEQKWRNCLNRAEKNGLQIIQGTDDAILDKFLKIYYEMSARKHLAVAGDIKTVKEMQALLPEHFKMNVIVILENGEPTAGVIITGIGKRGIYLFGATADTGMKNKASYLAQWRAIQWLKEMNCTEYDLNGINAESNPGVFSFKNGLCGKNGKQVEILGYFEAHHGITSRIILSAAHFANEQLKKLKNAYAKYQ
jgi:Acetyltransferase (GNAT) domain